MGTPPAGPSKAGYRVGALVIAVGVLGAVLWGILAVRVFTHDVDGFSRAPITGSRVLELTPGGYVLYYEGPGIPERVPRVAVFITPANGGTGLPVHPYGTLDSRGGHSYL